MERGGGMVLLGVCGEPGPARPGADVVVVEGRRRRLSPAAAARPPWGTSSSPSSSPSSLVGTGPPGMERPPGRLVVPPGGMVIDWVARFMGAPTTLGGRAPPWGPPWVLELRQAWMRFLPSGCVTSGCSLAVVKVYTRPVSETTRSNTWVPVRVDSS